LFHPGILPVETLQMLKNEKFQVKRLVYYLQDFDIGKETAVFSNHKKS
jgi:hypothetical protein